MTKSLNLSINGCITAIWLTVRRLCSKAELLRLACWDCRDQSGERLKLNREFFDERWSKHRIVTSMDWSTQVNHQYSASGWCHFIVYYSRWRSFFAEHFLYDSKYLNDPWHCLYSCKQQGFLFSCHLYSSQSYWLRRTVLTKIHLMTPMAWHLCGTRASRKTRQNMCSIVR